MNSFSCATTYSPTYPSLFIPPLFKRPSHLLSSPSPLLHPLPPIHTMSNILSTHFDDDSDEEPFNPEQEVGSDNEDNAGGDGSDADVAPKKSRRKGRNDEDEVKGRRNVDDDEDGDEGEGEDEGEGDEDEDEEEDDDDDDAVAVRSLLIDC